MNTRSPLLALTLAALTACVGPSGNDGTAGPQGPQGEQGEAGADGVHGVDGEDLAAPEPAIAAVYPLALAQGRSGNLRVLGYFTEFSEATVVALGEGVEVVEVQLQSSTSLHVKVNVAADAELGLRALTVGDLTYGDPSKGTGITVGPTLHFSPSEFVAGEAFETEMRTSDIIVNATWDLENCVGLTISGDTRITARRFKLVGRVALAASLGECSIRLVENEETEDERVSVGNVTVTEPNAAAFNGEGLATGTLNQEAPVQYLLLTAEADQVVALRHQLDEDAGRDGTGPALVVYESGDLEPLFSHDGGDHWVEFYNDADRTLLIAVQGVDIPDEGLDFAVQSEIVSVPDLAAGLPTTGRVPLEAGRASWFRHHLQSASFLQVTVLAEEALDLQPRTWIGAGEAVLHNDVSHFDGLADAGAVVFRITDDEVGENDAMMQFTINLAVTELLAVDEDGNGSGTVTPEANAQPFIVTVPAGQVLSASASADGADMMIRASWLSDPERILSEGSLVQVPSAEERSLVLNVWAAELAAEVEFTLSTQVIEPGTIGDEGGSGSAPEVGAAWFSVDLEDNFLGDLLVTAEDPDALQSELGIFAADGSMLGGGTGDSIFAFIPAGMAFLAVSDAEFIAAQNQAFTVGFGNPLFPELNDEELAALPPAERRCHEGVFLDVGAMGERGVFEVDLTTAGDSAVWGIGLDWNGNPARNGNGPEQVAILYLSRPALLDAYTVATHDTLLYMGSSCGTEEITPVDGGLNDDGEDWNGNDLGVRSGINGVEITEAGVYYLYVDGYSPGAAGNVTLNVRLQDLD